MNYRIGEASTLLGIPTSTLRYYEDIELVSPSGREGNGYRRYDDASIARLRFIASAKSVGIPLEDIRTLADAYELDDCSTVVHQVVESVALRITETRDRISELSALESQLEQVLQRMQVTPASGPCCAGCPCESITQSV